MLIWVVLVLGALGVFFVLGRSLWRKAKLLMAEVSRASEALATASAGLQEPAEPPNADPAVFADPSRLRQDRILSGRRRRPSTNRPRQSVR